MAEQDSIPAFLNLPSRSEEEAREKKIKKQEEESRLEMAEAIEAMFHQKQKEREREELPNILKRDFALLKQEFYLLKSTISQQPQKPIFDEYEEQLIYDRSQMRDRRVKPKDFTR
jgi:hypothetical protein